MEEEEQQMPEMNNDILINHLRNSLVHLTLAFNTAKNDPYIEEASIALALAEMCAQCNEVGVFKPIVTNI